MIPQTPENALMKYEQVQRLIAAHHSELGILAKWESELIQILEEETKPVASPPAPKKRIVSRGFEYKGKTHHGWSHIGIYRDILKQLFQDFPAKRQAIASAVGFRGYSRKYISCNREELFTGKSLDWVLKYSDVIVDGWYMDTNVKSSTIRKLLITAVKAADLNWNSDVKVYWEATLIID